MFGWGYKKDIEVFAQATSQTISDRFRRGDVIYLPAEGDLLITGDIHGNLENFRRIQEIAKLDSFPGRHVVIHELLHNIYNEDFQGDYSYECLLEAARWKNAHPDQVHYIMGNHELCELQGKEIMKDGKPIPLVFGAGSARRFGGSGGQLRDVCKALLKSLPIGVHTQAGVWFSHSTPEKQLRRFSLEAFSQAASPSGTAAFTRMDDQAKTQMIDDLVWGRDYSISSAQEFAQKVRCQVLVVGHTPCGPEGFSIPNAYHVILDSKDSNAAFLYLRLDKKYNQKGVVANIRKLYQ